MRKGTNPQKSRPHEKSEFYHQVIIPVYIPSNEGYFTDCLEIFKICVDSLIKSSHPQTFITIVNNGSCADVVDHLDSLIRKGTVHEVIHTSNIGKVNAIFKGLTGQSFPLVTISDADVLFTNGWQKAAYEIFDAMPKAGAVCTTPLSRRLKDLTSNLIFENFFSKDLKFSPVHDSKSMKEFALSIDDERFLRPVHLKSCMTITRNNVTALVGAGHFVCTYKGDIFRKTHYRFCENYIGGEALHEYLDRPVVRNGYWRLSTERNFTWHMGNVAEPWMSEKCSSIIPQEKIAMPRLDLQHTSAVSWWIKGVMFAKIIYTYKCWKKFLMYKGLSKSEALDY